VPSPFNPRKKYDTPEDMNLQKSIESMGVIQNLVVRKSKNDKLEVVCGHRRMYASQRIAKANGNGTGMTIPVTIRTLTDDQVLEIMTVENLQRKGLTEFEEAEHFKSYVDRIKNGKEAIDTLSGRLGIKPGYIRKRVAIMELPKKMLKSWQAGDLAFGHLEQLIRIQDPEFQKSLYDMTLKNSLPVSRLRSQIDWRTPELKDAMFSKKTAKCAPCHHNTSAQQKLFDIDISKSARCLNPTCFLDNTRKHLSKSFKKTKAYLKNKTNGFRFRSEIDKYESMWAEEVDAECKKCQNYVTIFDIGGGNTINRACLDPRCYNNKRKAASTAASGKKAKPKGAPRVDWHGLHFREKFYSERIPEIIDKDLKPNSEVTLRLAVFSVIHGHKFLHTWFARKYGLEKKQLDKMEDGESYYFRLDGPKIFDVLKKLKLKELQILLKEATAVMIVNKEFFPENRQIVAEHLDIDLKKEWTPDQEYFDKKHKAEILTMGHKFKVFAQKPVKDYLSEKFGKQPSQIEILKKGEVVDLFLKSGADLSGVVPDEIWKVK
jgi:ParB/RepB/Spo0J family partition protein